MPDMGLIRVLPEISISRSYWVVFHESLKQSRRVRVFSDFLSDCVAKAS